MREQPLAMRRACRAPVFAGYLQDASTSLLDRRSALRNGANLDKIRSECGNFIVTATEGLRQFLAQAYDIKSVADYGLGPEIDVPLDRAGAEIDEEHRV